MPCRCILKDLITEPVPKELQVLDPLSKQLIQRGKAFQAIFRLGTYTGKVPNYNSLKACKGTMFFLPLPLEKTLQTIDEVHKNKSGEGLAGLPDPELYIIVNGKPSKNKILWQSVVNVHHVKAAFKKLRETNWVYADVEDDDASRRVIECVSEDPQYVFFLLWQKELRELAAGVYNLLMGRRQHVMPVGEFMDRVSKSDEDVEANLSTVFQSVRGCKQYWFLSRSEVLCMLREYGSPTLFLTLSCAEYESLRTLEKS